MLRIFYNPFLFSLYTSNLGNPSLFELFYLSLVITYLSNFPFTDLLLIYAHWFENTSSVVHVLRLTLVNFLWTAHAKFLPKYFTQIVSQFYEICRPVCDAHRELYIKRDFDDLRRYKGFCDQSVEITSFIKRSLSPFCVLPSRLSRKYFSGDGRPDLLIRNKGKEDWEQLESFAFFNKSIPIHLEGIV